MLVLDEELVAARREALATIKAAGLYLPQLSRVDVCRGWLPSLGTYAVYYYDYRLIVVPWLSGAWYRQPVAGLAGILIHEYGHAIDDLLELGERWNQLEHPFHRYGVSQKYSPQRHVTKYAATQGAEDFAECYLHLALAGGKIRRSLPKRIRQKLSFVRKVVQCRSRGQKYRNSL